MKTGFYKLMNFIYFAFYFLKNITQSAMKTKNYWLLLVFLLIIPRSLFAQMAIGEWGDHLPYSSSIQVALAGDKVYCCTENAIFTYRKNTQSIEKLSKINGLSDIDISAMAYSNDNEILVVGYDNGNLDLIQNNTIYNLPDIKRKQMSGYKTIFDIMFINQYAYLSCAFGIVVVDVERREIADTYYIGDLGSQLEVFDMAFDGSYLYAATEEGIRRANINSTNLVNYANWHSMNELPFDTARMNAIAYANNQLYANFRHPDSDRGDTVYVFTETTWDYLDTTFLKNNRAIVSSGEEVLVIGRDNIAGYNTANERLFNIYEYDFGYPAPFYALYDENHILWIADNSHGLVRNENIWSSTSIKPNSPAYNNVVDISIENNVLWAAAGSQKSPWDRKGAYILSNGLWQNVNHNTTPDLGGVLNISQVIVDPANSARAFGGSWGYGLVEFNGTEIANIYDHTNSPLENIPPYTEGFIRVGGMAFDNNQNLWLTTSEVSDPLYVLKSDGTWHHFDFNYSGFSNTVKVEDLLITRNGYKWIAMTTAGRIYAYDDNGTIEDESDDMGQGFSLTDANGQILSNRIYDFVEDDDGAIWVGTDKGIIVYFNPGNIFNENPFYAQRIITYDENGDPKYLFETETVTALAVDGANRKWVGTQNAGVFLISDDGTEQVQHFNTSNSPLLSDNIVSISINHENGEVFFGTEKGIISYRATATEGEEEFTQVYVFPNPVRETYYGDIVVTGLVANVNVKITDISGNIVYETTAQGGQAVWDGNTFSGDRVQTGVYLIFCTNEDGSKTHVTKLLVIN